MGRIRAINFATLKQKTLLRFLAFGGMFFTSFVPSANSGMLPFYWDFQLSSSYLSLPVISGQTPPTLLQSSLGASAAWEFDGIPLFIGASSDFRWIQPLLNSSSAIEGNWKGTRFNFISPLMGFRLLGFTVKGDVQLLGDYVLSGKTPTGESIRYQKPWGARLQILRSILPVLKIGIQGEYLTFGEQKLSNHFSTPLNPKFSTWSAGLVGAVSF